LLEIYGIFRELQNIAGLSSKFLGIMPEPHMVCFRRSKKLKDHLVRARLHKLEVAARGMVKCGGKKCKVCDSIVVADTFQVQYNGARLTLTITLIVTLRGGFI
jgi:hypothetical protein